uniref:Dendrocyte expressed seven transmembrane protein n=1 Tax=Takifugu rubripes TaxID=31033 RepID=H2T8T0_TAKRU
MLLSWTSVQQCIKDVGSLSVDVFTSDKRGGFQSSLILLLTCSLSSLLLSSLLLLYLHFTLRYELVVAGGIAGSSMMLLTVALFLSKRVRCFGTLLVVSVFMKNSRNLLLTTGTSVVVLRNIRNTWENLSVLLKSMICNLKSKKAAIVVPLMRYKEMLKWVANRLWKPDLGIVKLTSQSKISTRLKSEEFEAKLSEAEHKLNETVQYVQSIVDTVSSVTEKMFPAVSFLVLAAFIVLHVKKFHDDLKYKNKFIGGRFVEFDRKRRAEGKAHVLPLTAEEEKLYTVPSIRPTFRDRRAMLKFSIPVVSQFVIWVVFITVDALMYWLVAIITTTLTELEPFHVRLLLNIQVSVLEVTDSFNPECLPTPTLLLHTSVIPLALIVSILVVMILMAAKVAQLRLLVCERFFPGPTEARVEYLHAKILKKRQQRRPVKVTAPYSKLHFWFPLIFRPREIPQTTPLSFASVFKGKLSYRFC